MTTEEAVTAIKTWIGMMRKVHSGNEFANEFIDSAWFLAKEQMKIVRCKDCKHQSVYCTTVDCNMRTTCTYFCILHGTYHEQDFFCAYGERRTE